MRDWKDRLGIFASAACAVHCAATPVLVATLPTLKLTEWMADPRFHQIVAVLCCGLVALAIAPMAWRFRDVRLLALASTGLGLILTSAFLMPESCCSTPGTTAHAESHSHDDSHAGHNHPHPDHSLTQAEDESPTLLMAGMGLAQPWMTPIGGLLLILAHGLNMRRRWSSSCDKRHCCLPSHHQETMIAIPLSDRDSTESPTLARAS
ncbi:MAG: MerC domain-containing protein [Planctomycetota bacterium]|jgi:hypothetical protein